MMDEINFSSRQAELYAFLIQRGDKWTRMQTAVNNLDQYPDYGINFHNSGARRLLTSDIEAINSSDQYEKIIISGNHGIKLASEKEYRRFLTSEYAEIFRKLKRVRKIARKAGKDQQHSLEGPIREAFLGGMDGA